MVGPRIREALRRHLGLLGGVGLLLVCGAFWGWFAWWSHVGHVPGKYRLDWTVELEDGSRSRPARWIVHTDEHLLGYYRKTFNAPSQVLSAWVQVSAPYSFNLYVNGRPVGGSFYKSSRATAVFDITRQIEPGRNTLAISNVSRTFDEVSRVVVAGAVVDWQGNVTPILSNEGWKAHDKYARQVQRSGKPEWFYPNFEDSHWAAAQPRQPPGPDDLARETFPPRVLRDPPPLGWVWAQQPAAEEIFVRRNLRGRGKVRDAWLRIAARHAYTLFVNGYKVGFREEGVVDSPQSTALDIYDIGRYLGRGDNVIAVKARRSSLDHGLVVDGYYRDASGTHEMETRSGRWKVSEIYHRGWTEKRFDDSAWPEAAPLRTDAPSQVASFVKVIQDEVEPPRDFRVHTFLGRTLFGGLGALVFLALGMGAVVLSQDEGAPPYHRIRWGGLGAMGLASLLPVAVLGLVWLIGYDVRFDPSFSFRGRWVWTALAVMLAACAGLALMARRGAAPAETPRFARSRGLARLVWRHRHLTVLVLILLAGTWARFQHLAFETIGADEIKMLAKSSGIMKLGFPHVIVAQELGVRLSVTSELVHYPMAWTILAFGQNELALRIPGVLFSLLTVVLLYRFGQMLHSRWAGLLAAGAFALLPTVIRMSQLARYPSQLAFFTVLTVYLFWRWMSQEDIGNRYLWYVTASYIATYLTWEGSGFLIPSLFVAFVVTRPRDLRYTLTHPRLVGCVFFIALVILLQLNIRAMVAGDLYIYGTGTSELTLVPTWNHSNFDPLYYLDNFFFIENHQILSWLFFLGVPLAFTKMTAARGMRFLYAVTFMNLFIKTCFLQIRNWRYTYNLVPLLCLVAAVVLLTLFEALGRVARRSGGLAPQARLAHRLAVGSALILLLLGSTAYILRLYELPGTHGLPRTRLEDRYYPTINDAVAYMDRHLRDDDIIISPVPHLVDFYIRDADYFLETILHFQVFLNPTHNTTMHRVSGTQAILSYEDLQKVVATHNRVWFVTSPLDSKLLDDKTHDWINENMTVVYENIASMVYLSEK